MTIERIHLDDETLQALAGGLDDDSARAHVVACDRCAEAVDAYRVLFAELGGLDDPAPDPAFVGDVMGRIDAVAAAPAPARARAPWLGLLGGLGAVVAAVAAWILTGGSVAGIVVDGVRTLASAAKVQTYFGDLFGALPPLASASLVVAQLLFLGLVLLGLTRLLRGEAAEPAAEAA